MTLGCDGVVGVRGVVHRARADPVDARAWAGVLSPCICAAVMIASLGVPLAAWRRREPAGAEGAQARDEHRAGAVGGARVDDSARRRLAGFHRPGGGKRPRAEFRAACWRTAPSCIWPRCGPRNRRRCGRPWRRASCRTRPASTLRRDISCRARTSGSISCRTSASLRRCSDSGCWPPKKRRQTRSGRGPSGSWQAASASRPA